MKQQHNNTHTTQWNVHEIVLLIAIPAIVLIAALSVGRYPVSINSLASALAAHLSGQPMDASQLALIRVRMPRVLIAMIIGASLSASGAAFQGLFKNPVVSPDLLGASSGASFGAALSILLGAGIIGTQLSSFIVGLIAVMIVAAMNMLLSKRAQSTLTLILCGILVSSLFNAFVSLIKAVADTDTKLPAITFWLMGGLSSTTLDDLRIVFIFLPTMVLLLCVRWKINVLAMGDEEAHMLGVNVTLYRWIIIICATLLTSLSVSIAGNVGWVGLVVPHLARMLVGSNYLKLLPATLIMGASFLLLVDTFARMLFTVEIPLSIITAIIGAPFFFYLMLRNRKGFGA